MPTKPSKDFKSDKSIESGQEVIITKPRLRRPSLKKLKAGITPWKTNPKSGSFSGRSNKPLLDEKSLLSVSHHSNTQRYKKKPMNRRHATNEFKLPPKSGSFSARSNQPLLDEKMLLSVSYYDNNLRKSHKKKPMHRRYGNERKSPSGTGSFSARTNKLLTNENALLSPSSHHSSSTQRSHKKKSLYRAIEGVMPTIPIGSLHRSRSNESVPSVPSTSLPPSEENPDVVKDMIASWKSNPQPLDVTLKGRAGEKAVRASKVVLGGRNRRLRELLAGTEHSNSKGEDEKAEAVLILGDYSHRVVTALAEYCLLNEFSLRESEPSREMVTDLVELATMANELQFNSLYNETYRRVRRLLREYPPLACTVYNDDCISFLPEFETCAIKSIRAFPEGALLWDDNIIRGEGVNRTDFGGVQTLSSDRLEELLRDEIIREKVQGVVALRVLRKWADGNTTKNARQIAKTIASKHVGLVHISLAQLRTQVRESGLFDSQTINSVVQAREYGALQLLGKEDCHVDRVLVMGAKFKEVNGLYLRDEEDETQYVKEGDYDKGCVDFGLHYQKDAWHIAPATDLSNAYYKCFSGPNEVPQVGWFAVTGDAYLPAPFCKFIPSTSEPRIKSRVSSSESLPACYASEEELYGN